METQTLTLGNVGPEKCTTHEQAEANAALEFLRQQQPPNAPNFYTQRPTQLCPTIFAAEDSITVMTSYKVARATHLRSTPRPLATEQIVIDQSGFVTYTHWVASQSLTVSQSKLITDVFRPDTVKKFYEWAQTQQKQEK